MKLRHDWRYILRKAWSIRLILLAGVLSGLEVILPMFVNSLPHNVFGALAFFVTALAFVARLVAQEEHADD